MRASAGTWAPTGARTIPGYFDAVLPTVPLPILHGLLVRLAREASSAGAEALARCPLPAVEDEVGRVWAPAREDAEMVLAAIERAVATGARPSDRAAYAESWERALVLRFCLGRQASDVRVRCSYFGPQHGVLHRQLDRRLGRGEPGAADDAVVLAAQYAARALSCAAGALWQPPVRDEDDAPPRRTVHTLRRAESAALDLEGLWHLQGEREVRYGPRDRALHAAEQRVLGIVRAALRRRPDREPS